MYYNYKQMLATSLHRLISDGLFERVQYNEMPLRIEYSPTEKEGPFFYSQGAFRAG